MPQFPIEVLWCANARGGKGRGWSFPAGVERHLRELTDGRRVLHLFGGASRWGTRLDIDPRTRPHVIGDAWMAPFRPDTFDVVILDPPYFHLNTEEKGGVLRQGGVHRA